ncbi:MAG: hypothetical protein M0016_00020 [Deltaproteobacteria bacterium]|jgi:uncharacterized HAD superfamily protein|nr:hypothetical protein [Deltaproteobacteria bacterium]
MKTMEEDLTEFFKEKQKEQVKIEAKAKLADELMINLKDIANNNNINWMKAQENYLNEIGKFVVQYNKIEEDK